MEDYTKEIPANSPTSRPSDPLYPLNGTLLRRINTGALVCWAFAGISLFNLWLVYFKAPIRIPYGLFITDLFFYLGNALNGFLAIFTLGVDLILIGTLAALGFAVRRRVGWAHWIAIVGLDILGLVWLLVKASDLEVIEFILHGLVIYYLWQSLQCSQIYRKREAAGLV